MMRRLQDDFDRLFGKFPFGQSLGERESSDWTPAIEAFQRGSDFIVRAEVPGLSRDDLSVEVAEDVLGLEGEVPATVDTTAHSSSSESPPVGP